MWLPERYSATGSTSADTIRDRSNHNARTFTGLFQRSVKPELVDLVRLRWLGFERCVSQGHCGAVAIACDIHDGIKLLGQRLDKTCTEPALVFARFHIRLADAVIGNRQLPVGFRDSVRNHDCRILLRRGERML